MDGMKITMRQLRDAILLIGGDGAEVSNSDVCDALGIEDDLDRARLRRRMQHMQSIGELIRVREGVYICNFDSCERRSTRTLVMGTAAMWRFVRSQKAGWGIREMMLYCKASYSHAQKYCAWLRREGYIELFCKNRNKNLFRGSAKAALTPETPLPPRWDTWRYYEERAAAAKIIRAVLFEDLDKREVRERIMEECDMLRRILAKHENQGGLDVQQ